MAEKPIQIGPIAKADREQLAELFAADLRDLRISQPLERLVEVIDRVRKEGRKHAILWGAKESSDGPVLGALFANVFYSVKHGGRAVWLEQLYVDPEARKRGIGRALVQHLLDWARQNGIRGIDLESYQLNAPASILYRSLGFRRLGRERFSIELEESQ